MKEKLDYYSGQFLEMKQASDILKQRRGRVPEAFFFQDKRRCS
jgi:hypothetical protein